MEKEIEGNTFSKRTSLGHLNRKKKYIPTPGDWYSYLPDNKPDVVDIKVIDRFDIACPKCSASRSVSVHQLKRRIKRYGFYECKNCVCRNTAVDSLSKRKESCKTSLGVEFPQQSLEVQNRTKVTNLNRYGKEYVGQVEIFKQKRKETSLVKYGGATKSQGGIFLENSVRDRKQLFDKVCAYLKENNTHCHDPKTLEKFNIKTSSTLHKLLREFGGEELFYKNGTPSVGENEVAHFLEGLDFRIMRNDRTLLRGKEMDIYIPALRLGIEYNGNYWHSSELHPDKNRHLHKRELAEKVGIRLIQIRSDEWDMKRPIVESILKAILNKSEHRYFARKLTVQKVSGPESRRFLQNNHLMGVYAPGRSVGLYTEEGVLVQLFVYQLKKDQTELDCSRICSLRGHSVVGGVSRLLKWALRQHPQVKGVVSFVDLRYSDGHSLEKIGFVRTGVTLGFGWTDGLDWRNRRTVRANRDLRGLTEREYSEEDGVFKIYDAGQAKYYKDIF